MKITKWEDGTYHIDGSNGAISESEAKAFFADQKAWTERKNDDDGRKKCKHSQTTYKGFDYRPTCVVCGKRL